MSGQGAIPAVQWDRTYAVYAAYPYPARPDPSHHTLAYRFSAFIRASARLGFYALALTLCACAANPSQPDIVAHVVQAPPVEIAVPVPCLKAAHIPTPPATAFTPDPSEWSAAQEEARAGHPDRLYAYVNKLTQQAIADVDALDAYVLKVQPLLAACAALPEVSK